MIRISLIPEHTWKPIDVVAGKPMTPTVTEAEELVRLALERGRLLTVNQVRLGRRVPHG